MGIQLNRSFRRSKLAALARGRQAEAWARIFLMLKFYRILEKRRKARAGGVGEIDIIARRGGVLAFIEVKTRADQGRAAESLSWRQRQRLRRGAEAFLAGRPDLAKLVIRFDAILLAPGRWPRHVIDAWREED